MTNKWTARALNKSFAPSQSDGTSPDEKVVILMQGKNVFNDQIFCYLELTMAKAFEMKKHMDEGGELSPSDYGTVIAAGKGYPSDELKAEMAAAHNLIDAPAPKPANIAFPRPPSFWGEEEESGV